MKRTKNKIIKYIGMFFCLYSFYSCNTTDVDSSSWFSRHSSSNNSRVISIKKNNGVWIFSTERGDNLIEFNGFKKLTGRLNFDKNKVFVSWDDKTTCIESTLLFDLGLENNEVYTFWPSMSNKADTLRLTQDSIFYCSAYSDTIHKFTIHKFSCFFDEDLVFYVGKNVGFVGHYCISNKEKYILCATGNLFFQKNDPLFDYDFSPRIL